jgi:hypothetical protein
MAHNYTHKKHNGWYWFQEKEQESERKVEENGVTYIGSAEFRIPISPTPENIRNALEVVRSLLSNPKDIKLPKNIKLLNVNEVYEEGSNVLSPENGPDYDQRGKELCFYVTWDKDSGAPSLTADDYKKFMLHMVRALYDGGVKGIGYYPSLNADRRFKLPDGTFAPFATHIEYIADAYYNNHTQDNIKFEGDGDLFYKEEVFAKHGSKNPLRKIVISQQDLADAGLTPEILQAIENNHKQYILQDFPQRLELLNDKFNAFIEKKSPNPREPKDELKKNHASLRKECLGLLKVPDLPNTLDWHNTVPNGEELLTNACKHLATEAREFRAIASPIIKRLKDGYKTHDIEKFAKTAEEVFGEMNPNLNPEQKDAVKEKARDVFVEIRENVQHDKEPMSILFGYGVENARLKEKHTHFVDLVVNKGNSAGQESVPQL